jgi:hypothetical protein
MLGSTKIRNEISLLRKGQQFIRNCVFIYVYIFHICVCIPAVLKSRMNTRIALNVLAITLFKVVL